MRKVWLLPGHGRGFLVRRRRFVRVVGARGSENPGMSSVNQGSEGGLLNFENALLISPLFLGLMFSVAFGNGGVFVGGCMKVEYSYIVCCIFFFKQKTAYEIRLSLVGSEMCIRDRVCSSCAEGDS